MVQILNNPACNTRVKLISKTCKSDFKHATCSLTISVGQLNHEKDRLLATILKINESFNSCNIMICDTLQRHNIWQTLGEHTPKKAMYDCAKLEGQKWLERNKNAINSLKIPFKITHWDYWLKHPHYYLEQKYFEKTLMQNHQYLRVLNETAHEYKDRLIARGDLRQSETNKIKMTITQSKQYLIEESIVMLLMNNMTNYKYELYPGKRNLVLDYVHEYLMKNNDMVNLHHVSIKYISRKQ